MIVTGVVAALDIEARTLGPSRRRAGGLRELGGGTLLAISGIGQAAAAAAAQTLLDAGAAALMSWGVAGGLDPALEAGVICLPGAVISREGERFETDLHWRGVLVQALPARRRSVDGVLLTDVRALDTAADKAAALANTGALAVDMESLAVARVAAARGVPFVAVRVIVDTAVDVLPAAVMAASDADRIHLGRLIWELLRSPGQLGALLRLARRYSAAQRSLRAVACSGAVACGGAPARDASAPSGAPTLSTRVGRS